MLALGENNWNRHSKLLRNYGIKMENGDFYSVKRNKIPCSSVEKSVHYFRTSDLENWVICREKNPHNGCPRMSHFQIERVGNLDQIS